MRWRTLVTVLLVIVSVLLAIALFIAGAIWRGRITARVAPMDPRKSALTARLGPSACRDSEEVSA
jgi:hypothetical protein